MSVDLVEIVSSSHLPLPVVKLEQIVRELEVACVPIGFGLERVT
jgi:hypothetical protein